MEVKKVRRGAGRKAKSSQPHVKDRLPRGLGATMVKKCLVQRESKVGELGI